MGKGLPHSLQNPNWPTLAIGLCCRQKSKGRVLSKPLLISRLHSLTAYYSRHTSHAPRLTALVAAVAHPAQKHLPSRIRHQLLATGLFKYRHTKTAASRTRVNLAISI